MMKTTTTATALLLALFSLPLQAGQPVSAEVPNYEGAELYALNCANCHGIYGEGDGAVTPDLSVVLLDLRYLATRNGGIYPDDFVRQMIDGRETRAAHGPTGMPVWGAEFARGEGTSDAAEARVAGKIEAIVDFLGTLQIVE
jgi:mono/diheme cytochrome c family protein